MILDKFILAFGSAVTTGFFAWLAKTLSNDYLNMISEDMIEIMIDNEEKRKKEEGQEGEEGTQS